MRLKKRFFACAILVILLSLVGQATFAYFTTTAVAENVITAGGVSIDMVEKTADGGEFKNVIGIVPGDSVSKVVSVVNKQDDAYVRILLDIQIQDASGNPMDLTQAQLESILTLDYDTANWTLKDGAWYCNKALTASETTAPLFTEVRFSTDMSNEFRSCKVVITVQAQATQVANNGTDALTAAGWPEE